MGFRFASVALAIAAIALTIEVGYAFPGGPARAPGPARSGERVGHGARLESRAGVSPPGARTLEVQDTRRRALVGRIVAGGKYSGEFRPDLVLVDDPVLLTSALDGAASLAADRPDERGCGRRWAGPRYYLGPPQVVGAAA